MVQYCLVCIIGKKLLSAVIVLFETLQCTNVSFYELVTTGILAYSLEILFQEIKNSLNLVTLIICQKR